jgi:hypothetical protein
MKLRTFRLRFPVPEIGGTLTEGENCDSVEFTPLGLIVRRDGADLLINSVGHGELVELKRRPGRPRKKA